VTGSVVTVDRRGAGPRLIGYVTSDAEHAGGAADAGALAADLRDFLRERVPDAMVPAQVFVLRQWPTGAHGKVDVAALPQPSDERPATAAQFVAPATDVQIRLAALCAELLEVDRVGLEDSFFTLGGHSLLAIRAISRIRKEFGVGLQIGQFFKAPTLAGLAAAVEAKQAAASREPAQQASIPKIDRGAPRR
jgi:acyl carrier protein